MRSEKRMRAGMRTVGGQAAAQQPPCSSCAHCASLSSASDCALLAGLQQHCNLRATDPPITCVNCHACKQGFRSSTVCVWSSGSQDCRTVR